VDSLEVVPAVDGVVSTPRHGGRGGSRAVDDCRAPLPAPTH